MFMDVADHVVVDAVLVIVKIVVYLCVMINHVPDWPPQLFFILRLTLL